MRLCFNKLIYCHLYIVSLDMLLRVVFSQFSYYALFCYATSKNVDNSIICTCMSKHYYFSPKLAAVDFLHLFPSGPSFGYQCVSMVFETPRGMRLSFLFAHYALCSTKKTRSWKRSQCRRNWLCGRKRGLRPSRCECNKKITWEVFWSNTCFFCWTIIMQ